MGTESIKNRLVIRHHAGGGAGASGHRSGRIHGVFPRLAAVVPKPPGGSEPGMAGPGSDARTTPQILYHWVGSVSSEKKLNKAHSSTARPLS